MASDLDETVIPPPLDASCSTAAELRSITEAGGSQFAKLLSTWRHALFGVSSEEPPSASLALRVEAVLGLIAEAQARRILAGRRSTRTTPTAGAAATAVAADDAHTPAAPAGALARQRGALAACCAALRIARPAQGETPCETVARLREAAAAAGFASHQGSAAEAGAAAASADTASADARAAAAPPPSQPPPPPLLSTSSSSLTDAERATLERIAAALTADYETRRAMLLKRLDVLVTTFGWSPRLQGDAERRAEMLQEVERLVGGLPPPARFGADDAFKADASLLELQRAVPVNDGRDDGGGGGIKKVRIGNVPDRGGRTGDAYAPTQTFVQQQREREQGRGGGGGGGGSKGKGGGRGKGGGGGRGRR